MRIDIKSIEGLLSACKAVLNTGKEFTHIIDNLFHIPKPVFEQVREAIKVFEKGQK